MISAWAHPSGYSWSYQTVYKRKTWRSHKPQQRSMDQFCNGKDCCCSISINQSIHLDSKSQRCCCSDIWHSFPCVVFEASRCYSFYFQLCRRSITLHNPKWLFHSCFSDEPEAALRLARHTESLMKLYKLLHKRNKFVCSIRSSAITHLPALLCV